MATAVQPIKLRIARAQLGTALELFVRNKDPVSVHCLACGASELLDGLALHHGIAAFSTQILETYPDMRDGELKGLRNQYWNAFKHFKTHDGQMRTDEELLEKFDDTQNDAVLFLAWYDYQSLTRTLPIAAQVFQIWWFAMNESKLSPSADVNIFRREFPEIVSIPRIDQKKKLRRSVEKWRNEKALLADPRTEEKLQTDWPN